MNTFQNFLEAQKKLASAKKEFAEAQQAVIEHVGEGNKARFGDNIFTVSKGTVATSTSWKSAFELALSKVNEPTKNILQLAVKESQKEVKRKPSVRVALKPE